MTIINESDFSHFFKKTHTKKNTLGGFRKPQVGNFCLVAVDSKVYTEIDCAGSLSPFSDSDYY